MKKNIFFIAPQEESSAWQLLTVLMQREEKEKKEDLFFCHSFSFLNYAENYFSPYGIHLFYYKEEESLFSLVEENKSNLTTLMNFSRLQLPLSLKQEELQHVSLFGPIILEGKTFYLNDCWNYPQITQMTPVDIPTGPSLTSFFQQFFLSSLKGDLSPKEKKEEKNRENNKDTPFILYSYIHAVNNLAERSYEALEFLLLFLKKHPNSNIYLLTSAPLHSSTQDLLHHPMLEKYQSQLFLLQEEALLQDLSLLKNFHLLIGYYRGYFHLAATYYELPTLTFMTSEKRIESAFPLGEKSFLVAYKQEELPNLKDFQQLTLLLSTQLLSQEEFSPLIIEELHDLEKSTLSELYFFIKNSGVFLHCPFFNQRSDITSSFSLYYQLIFNLYFFDTEMSVPSLELISEAQNDLSMAQEGHYYFKELLTHGRDFSLYLHQELISLHPKEEEIQKYRRFLGEVDELAKELLSQFPYIMPIWALFELKKRQFPPFSQEEHWCMATKELIELTLSFVDTIIELSESKKDELPSEEKNPPPL